MKLSKKPKHFAPQMHVRDLSGRLRKRVYFTNSTTPGRRYAMRRHHRMSVNEAIIGGQQKLNNAQEDVNRLKKYIHTIYQFMRRSK